MANDTIVIEYQANIKNLEAKLDKVENDLRDVEKAGNDAFGEIEQKANDAGKAVDNLNKHTKDEISSINTLKKQLEVLTKTRDQSTDPKKIQIYNKHIKDTSEQIGKLQKNTGSLKDALSTLSSRLPFGSAIQEVQELGGSLKTVTNSVAGSSKAFQVLRVAIMGTGIGALIIAIGALVSYFTKTEAGAEGLERRLSQVGATVDVIIGRFARLGEGMLQLFRGDFSAAAETFSNSFKGIGEEIDNATTEAYEFTKALQDIEDAQRLLSVEVAKSINERQKLIIQSKNRKISEEEALKFLQQADAIERKMTQQQIDLQTKKVEALRRENDLKIKTGELDESNKTDELIQAEIELENLRGNSLEQLEKIQNRQDQLTERQLQNIEKAFQARLKAINEEEKLALDRAKLEHKTEGDLITIQEMANFQRIKLFEDFNKTKEFDYKEFLLKTQALEQAYSTWLVSEDAKRLEEIKKHRELVLSETERTAKIERNINEEEFQKQFEDIANQYQNHIIDRTKFEEEYNRISNDFKKKQLQDEIDLINQELLLVEDGTDKQIELQSKLNAAKKDLYDLDFQEFKKKEEEKTKKDKEEVENRKKLLKQFSDESINIAQNTLNAINEQRLNEQVAEIESERNSFDIRQQNLLKSLEDRKNAGLISEEQFNKEKIKLDLQKAQKESELKKKQFIAEQNANVNRIRIDTATAVIKTFAQLGFTPQALIAVGALLANAAIQTATIRNTPVPKFKDGVIRLNGPGTETSDSIPAMLSKNESVIKAKQSIKHTDALRAIQDDYFDKFIYENHVVPAMREAEKRERNLRVRQANTADNIMKALEINGFGDMSHLERLTKSNKKVIVQNLDGLPKEIGKEMSRIISNNNYMK